MAAAIPPEDPEIDRHDRFIRGLARVLVLDPHRAEDVAQATWLAALTHRRPAEGIHAWLATLVRHFASNARRSAARVARRERLAARPERVPSALEIRERESARHAIVEAVLALEEPYQTTMVLRYLEGHPPRVVARSMGVPVETVRTRTRRALELLRARLDREHGGRGAWCTALLPFARGAGAPSAFTTLISIAGALIVTTKTKLALAALCCVALSLALWKVMGPTPGRDDGVAGLAGRDVASPVRLAGTRPSVDAAASRSAMASAASAATFGSLLVRAIWEDDHEPAAGIGLRLSPRGAPEPMFAERDVSTDARGEARVDRLAPGALRVTVDRDGKVSDEKVRTTSIEAGKQTELLVTLDAGYTVCGIVVDPEGVPVSGAEVLTGIGAQSLSAHSAADGTFTLRGCTGVQLLAARAPGYAPSQRLQIWWGKGARVPARITLSERAGALAGLVHDEQGRPIANAILEVGGSAHNLVRSGADEKTRSTPAAVRMRSDAAGRFSNAMLPPGRQKVRARAAGNTLWSGEVMIVAGSESALDIRLVPGASVFGVVLDARGEPAAEVEVRLGDAIGLAAVQALTKDDGGYELRGLAPGAAELLFTARSRGKSRARITVVAGERVRCDARLDAGLQLAGRVLDQRGAPVVSAFVEGYSEGHEPWSGSARTDEHGAFRLTNCNDAPTRVTVRCEQAGLEKLAFKEARPGPEEVVITLEEVRAPSVLVAGAVVGTDGNACCGAQVFLTGSGGGDRLRQFSDPVTGAFRFGPATPGRYSLSVSLEGLANLHVGPRDLKDGETWELGALRFAVPGHLEVRAVGPDSAPLTRANGRIVSAGGVTQEGIRIVDGRGQCLLSPGSYVLLMERGPYADQDVPFTIESDRTQLLRVALRPGVNQVVRVRLPEGDASETVNVVVRGADGTATLRRQFARWTTGGFGDPTLGLAPGSYDVEAQAESGARASHKLEVGDGGKTEPLLLDLK